MNDVSLSMNLMDRTSSTIYVSNIRHTTPVSSISNIFSKFGPLERCEIPENKFGKTRGFAFIEFENKDNANNAYTQLSKQEIMLDGRVLKLEWAKATKLYKEDIQNLSGETRERFMGNFRNQNSLDSKFSKNKRKPQKRFPNSPGPYETIAATQNQQQLSIQQPSQQQSSQLQPHSPPSQQQSSQLQPIMPQSSLQSSLPPLQQQSNHVIQPPSYPPIGPQSSPNQMLNGHKLLNKSYSNVSPIGTSSNGNMVVNLYGSGNGNGAGGNGMTPTSASQANGNSYVKKNVNGGMVNGGGLMMGTTGVLGQPSFDIVSNIQALNISPTQQSNKPFGGLTNSNGNINNNSTNSNNNLNNNNGFIVGPTNQSNMIVGLSTLSSSNGNINTMNHPSLVGGGVLNVNGGQSTNGNSIVVGPPKSYLLDTSPILTSNGISGINGTNLHHHSGGNGGGGGLPLSSSSHSLSSSSSSTSSLTSSNNLTSPKPSPPTSSTVNDFNSDFLFTTNPSAFQTTTIDFNPIPPISKLQHQSSQELLPLPFSNNNGVGNGSSSGNHHHHHLNMNPSLSMINSFGNNSTNPSNNSSSSFNHHHQQQPHQHQLSTDEKEHLFLKPNFYQKVYQEPSYINTFNFPQNYHAIGYNSSFYSSN